jgi:hypothetical protein
LLEHRQRIGDQEEMRRLRKTSQVSIWLTVLITIAAWVILSNHCALAVLALPAETVVEAGGCPMHSASVPKKKPASKIPCCKDVRAIVATKCVTFNPAMEPMALSDCGTRDIALLTRGAVEVESLDTGPPGCLSFAELVLQESMRAHAPPVS